MYIDIYMWHMLKLFSPIGIVGSSKSLETIALGYFYKDKKEDFIISLITFVPLEFYR